MFLPNFFFTQLMDEGKKSENIFFTEVVSWKLPFQEGIFTCVTKWKNVFLEKTSFNLSSFISCVTLGKTIKNLNFSFSCVSDFFSPQEKTFSSLSETGWKKHFQDLFIYFFQGNFYTVWNWVEQNLHNLKNSEIKEKKMFFCKIFFFLICETDLMSETKVKNVLFHVWNRRKTFLKNILSVKTFFPSVFTFYLPNGTFWIEQHVEWDFSSAYQLSHYDPYRRYHTQSFSFCTRAEPKQTHTCCSGAFLGGDLGDMPQVYVNTANTFS